MKKLNSPIAWVGGKSRLRDTIIPLIPEHTCYVEVFAGGAWVYFGKEPSTVEVLNDVNGDLINMYRVIQTQPEAFYDALWYLFPSRDLHKASRATLDNPDRQVSDVERAALFYYHIRHAFGAKYGAGYALSADRPPKKLIALDFLTALRDRLANTHVENLSFEKLIANYDRTATFFYLDPPYVVPGVPTGDYYQHTFSEEKHHALHASLAASQARWLLSYDDTPFIRDLYKDHKIRKTKPVTYSLNNKGHRHERCELLISNY